MKMKATLEFNLDDQDEIMAHLRCVKSLDMALVLWEITYNMKRTFERKELNESQYELLEVIFQKIYDEINERGIVLDDMIV